MCCFEVDVYVGVGDDDVLVCDFEFVEYLVGGCVWIERRVLLFYGVRL